MATHINIGYGDALASHLERKEIASSLGRALIGQEDIVELSQYSLQRRSGATIMDSLYDSAGEEWALMLIFRLPIELLYGGEIPVLQRNVGW
jgi:hypothetical protein